MRGEAAYAGLRNDWMRFWNGVKRRRPLLGLVLLVVMLAPTFAPVAEALSVGTLTNVSQLPDGITTQAALFKDMDSAARVVDSAETLVNNATTVWLRLTEDNPSPYRVSFTKTFLGSTKGFTLPMFEVRAPTQNAAWTTVVPRETSTAFEVSLGSEWTALTDMLEVRVTESAVPWSLATLEAGGSVFGFGSWSSVYLDRATALWWSTPTWTPVSTTTVTENVTVDNVTTEVTTNVTVPGRLTLRFEPAIGRNNTGAPVIVNKSWVDDVFGISEPVFEWGHGDVAWKPLNVEENTTHWIVTPSNFSTITINQAVSGLLDGIIDSPEAMTYDVPDDVQNTVGVRSDINVLDGNTGTDSFPTGHMIRYLFAPWTSGFLTRVQSASSDANGAAAVHPTDFYLYDETMTNLLARSSSSAVNGRWAEFTEPVWLTMNTKYYIVEKVNTTLACCSTNRFLRETDGGSTGTRYSNGITTDTDIATATWITYTSDFFALQVWVSKSTFRDDAGFLGTQSGYTGADKYSINAVQSSTRAIGEVASAAGVTLGWRQNSAMVLDHLFVGMQCSGDAQYTGSIGVAEGSAAPVYLWELATDGKSGVTNITSATASFGPGETEDGATGNGFVKFTFDPVQISANKNYGLLLKASTCTLSQVANTTAGVWILTACSAPLNTCTNTTHTLDPRIIVPVSEWVEGATFVEDAALDDRRWRTLREASFSGLSATGGTLKYNFNAASFGSNNASRVTSGFTTANPGYQDVGLGRFATELRYEVVLTPTSPSSQVARLTNDGHTLQVKGVYNLTDATTRTYGTQVQNQVFDEFLPKQYTNATLIIPTASDAKVLSESRVYNESQNRVETTVPTWDKAKVYFDAVTREVRIPLHAASANNVLTTHGAGAPVTKVSTFTGTYSNMAKLFTGMNGKYVREVCLNGVVSDMTSTTSYKWVQLRPSTTDSTVVASLNLTKTSGSDLCAKTNLLWSYTNMLLVANTSNPSRGLSWVYVDSEGPADSYTSTDLTTFVLSPERLSARVRTGTASSVSVMASANTTSGTKFEITVPGRVLAGDYIIAQGLIRDVDDNPISGFETLMEVKNTDGSEVTGGRGPSYNATDGNFLSVMTSTYLAPGKYRVQISFNDTSAGVVAKKSWPITVGVGPATGQGPDGDEVPLYTDSVMYYKFFDNRTGMGLDQDFYKVYVSGDTTIDESDRVVGGSVPLVTGYTYYFAVKDYFNHVVFPPASSNDYYCAGRAGESCPLTVVPGQYGSVYVEKAQVFLDVGITTYQVKIKNTQIDPAYVQLTANGKTLQSYVLPGEVTELRLPFDNYTVSVTMYDALDPSRPVDYAYNNSLLGSGGPYWRADGRFGQVGQPSTPGDCLDLDEELTACSASAPQSESLTYFGTLDLQRVAIANEVKLNLYDDDGRTFHGFKVEVSDDPDHYGWYTLWDSTMNSGGGGSANATNGFTTNRAGNSTLSGADRDYQGLQTLTSSVGVPMRYVRVWGTGSTASAQFRLSDVSIGSSATASLVANKDSFLWIRGYDLYSIVFAINNVNSLIYDQQVNVGVFINNQDSVILNQTANIATMFNNTNTFIGQQTVNMFAAINNTNSKIDNQFIYQNARLNNTLSTVQNQFVFQNAQLNNTLSTVNNQFVFQNAQLNNTNTIITTQGIYQNTLINNTNSSITTQVALMSLNLTNLNSTVSNQFAATQLAISNLNSTVQNQFTSVHALINNTNASLQTQINLLEAEVLNNGLTLPSDPSTLFHHAYDDAQGFVARDASQAGNDGSLTSMEETDWVAGKWSGALDFDGVNEYVTTTVPLTTDFTACVWMNPDVVRTQGIIGDAGTLNNWRIYQQSGGRIEFDGNPGEIWNIQSPASVPAGEWTHVCGTFEDGTTDLATLYVNGEAVGTSTSDFTNSGTAVIQTSYNANTRFDGKLDDVRMYSRALNESEIRNVFANVNPAVLLQLNLLSQGVSNANVSIQSQLNVLKSTVSTTESNITNQTNAILAQAITQNSNLSGQFNYISAAINNTNLTTQNQINALSASISNFNASMQSQLNSIHSEIVNNGLTTALLGGTVGYWDFDEVAGVANDSSGFGNHANLSLVNGTRSTQGKLGAGIEFDGNDSVVYVPSTGGVFSGGSRPIDSMLLEDKTFSAFVFPHRTKSDGQAIITTRNTGVASGTGWTFALSPSNRLFFEAANGATVASVTGTLSVPVGQWSHVAMTYDNSTRAVKFYVDGSEDPASLTVSIAPTAGQSFSIGGEDGPLGANGINTDHEWGFDGYIDEVRAMNRVVTAEEMAALAKGINMAVMAQFNALSQSVSNANVSLTSQVNFVSTQIENQNTNLSSQFNQLQTNIVQRNANITTQVNALALNLSNSNASIMAQVNYLSLAVNNTNASIGQQLNGIASYVNNTNATVVQQANAIVGTIANMNANLTNQTNFLNVTIRNSETNISTQTNALWASVNNTNASIGSQLNAVQTSIVNQNTNISTQFNLVSVKLTNAESNLTNQTNVLQASIQNLNTSMQDQFNLVNVSIATTNASLANQLNVLSAQVSNSNLSVLQQVNAIWASVNNTNATVNTSFVLLNSKVDFNQATVNTSFAEVRADISFTNATILENITALNASVQARLLNLLSDVHENANASFDQSQGVLTRLALQEGRFNDTLFTSVEQVVANITLRHNQATNASLGLLENLTFVNTSLANAILQTALEVEQREAANISRVLQNASLAVQYIGSIPGSTVADYVQALITNFTDDQAGVFLSYINAQVVGPIREIDANLTQSNQDILNRLNELNDTAIQNLSQRLADVYDSLSRPHTIYIPNINYSNGPDTETPFTRLRATADLAQDNTIRVTYTAADNRAVVDVDIYVRKANESWAILASPTSASGVVFYADAVVGTRYDFKAIATDAVGNVEEDPMDNTSRANYVSIVYAKGALPYDPVLQTVDRGVARFVPGVGLWSFLVALGAAALLLEGRRRT